MLLRATLVFLRRFHNVFYRALFSPRGPPRGEPRPILSPSPQRFLSATPIFLRPPFWPFLPTPLLRVSLEVSFSPKRFPIIYPCYHPRFYPILPPRICALKPFVTLKFLNNPYIGKWDPGKIFQIPLGSYMLTLSSGIISSTACFK